MKTGAKRAWTTTAAVAAARHGLERTACDLVDAVATCRLSREPPPSQEDRRRGREKRTRNTTDGSARERTRTRLRTHKQTAVDNTRQTTDDSASCNDWRGRTANDDGSDSRPRDDAGVALLAGLRRPENICRARRASPETTEPPRAGPIQYQVHDPPASRLSRANGWTDGRTDGWMGGWMDGSTACRAL